MCHLVVKLWSIVSLLSLFSLESQFFDQEIVPVEVKAKRGQVTTVSKDEHPKPETSLETLAKLRPAFVKENGTVTAGMITLAIDYFKLFMHWPK